MHQIQKKLAKLSQTHDLRSLGLRQIARMIGENHPQKIKYHMQQMGILEKQPKSKVTMSDSQLIPIPLVGLANCGEATIYAESYDNQLLQVSQRVLPSKNTDLFAVQAVGDSMNQADINGNNIEDGDYVIIDPNDKDFKDGDYVLSLINEMANIKKFSKDIRNKQVILLSESTENYSPIYIHEDDLSYFMASGKVVSVLKSPKKNSKETILFKD